MLMGFEAFVFGGRFAEVQKAANLIAEGAKQAVVRASQVWGSAGHTLYYIVSRYLWLPAARHAATPIGLAPSVANNRPSAA